MMSWCLFFSLFGCFLSGMAFSAYIMRKSDQRVHLGGISAETWGMIGFTLVLLSAVLTIIHLFPADEIFRRANEIAPVR